MNPAPECFFFFLETNTDEELNWDFKNVINMS